MSAKVGRDINWLSRAAAVGTDRALARVVGMLDGLRQRGEADQVLDLARQRLRALKPPRPLGFGRLLFLPMDGAIVASPQWRRGEATIPRGALGVLAATVLARLGPEAGAIAQACEGRSTADPQAVAAIGGNLWPAAAAALPAAPPAGWDDAGLNPADYAAIAALCQPLWAQGKAIWAAMRAAADGPPENLVHPALAGLLPAGPRVLAAGLASLLQRAAAPGRVLAVAARLDGATRAVAQQMLDTVLDAPLPEFDQLDLKTATAQAVELVQRIEDLEQCGLMGSDRQRRLVGLKRAADEACRDRFLSGAEQQVIAPAALLISAPEVRDADVLALEAGARRLHALEAVGRRLGHPAAYARAVQTMCEALAGLMCRAHHSGGLQPIDLARSIELLAGPEAAEVVLAAAR